LLFLSIIISSQNPSINIKQNILHITVDNSTTSMTRLSIKRYPTDKICIRKLPRLKPSHKTLPFVHKFGHFALLFLDRSLPHLP
jgi:hypothetical protein